MSHLLQLLPVLSLLQARAAGLSQLAQLTPNQIWQISRPFRIVQSTVTLSCSQFSYLLSEAHAFHQPTSSAVPKESPSRLETTDRSAQTIITLGALLGLSVVLLAVVTTGWVHMYLVTKRRTVTNDPTYTGYIILYN